jgi:hypothetical protein
MDIIFNNAKAFVCKESSLDLRFLDKVTLHFNDNVLLFYRHHSSQRALFSFPFDPQYIYRNSNLDIRYFTDLLRNIFLNVLKIKNVNLRFVLPQKWGIFSENWDDSLTEANQERNLILFLQKEFSLSVLNYEFILDFKNKCSLAVSKVFLHNWMTCFQNIKLDGIVSFEIAF